MSTIYELKIPCISYDDMQIENHSYLFRVKPSQDFVVSVLSKLKSVCNKARLSSEYTVTTEPHYTIRWEMYKLGQLIKVILENKFPESEEFKIAVQINSSAGKLPAMIVLKRLEIHE